MKKILSVFLIITVVASLFAFPVYAEDATATAAADGYVTFSLSDGTTATKTSFLMNKQFSSKDTKDDLKADGYSLSNVDTYSDTYGLARRNSSGAMSVFYKGATFGGAYTLETVAAKGHNWGYLYFNYVNSDNYYRIDTKSDSSSSATLKIQKKVGGTLSSLLTDSEGATVDSKTISMGTNGKMTYKVSLSPDATTGDLSITVTMTNSAGVSKTYTVTDKKTDTYSPMTSGYIGYGNSYVNISSSKENQVNSFKVYPGTSANNISGVFKNDGVETNEYTSGKTTFGLPVALIGESPSFIAALYDGNDMVDVKILDLADINAGDVKLFDKAGKKVKVFMWESLTNVTPIDLPFELPKVIRPSELLDEKKVIFIGNSFTYWGRNVLNKDRSILTQSARSNDTGYFYQICKANGLDVSVTNWTFGSHALYNLFGDTACTVSGSCNGVNHESYLTDTYFDYVFIQQGRGTTSASNLIPDIEYIMELFKKSNPNVKFLFLGYSAYYGIDEDDTVNTAYENILEQYDDIEALGIEVVDWGKLVAGIINGEYAVPGGVKTYNKSSFIVDDGYHPNMLTGYITALSAYTAITGQSAVGQSYSFYNDTTAHSSFDTAAYIEDYYPTNTTNFTDIFASASDMKGIQTLIDQVVTGNNQ